jgi:hypothetical protein
MAVWGRVAGLGSPLCANLDAGAVKGAPPGVGGSVLECR